MRSVEGHRRRAAMVVGAALFAAGSLGGASTAQGVAADTIVDVGWWWKVQTGTLTDLPAPPNVTQGQLQVQGAVDGPISMAAIKATLPAGTTAPALTLTVAQAGDQGGALAVILACKAVPGWTGVEAGRWASRPETDCAGGSAVGQRSVDGTTWTFALTPLVEDDAVDLVLVPGRLEGAPAGVDGSTFTQIFEAPTVEAFGTGGASSDGDPASPAPEVLTPGGEPPATGDPGLGFSSPPLDSGDFGLPPLGDSGVDLGPIDQDLPSSPTAVENTGGPTAVAAAPIGAELPGPSSAARAAGFVILVLGGLWTAWAWTRQPGQGLLPVPGTAVPDAGATRPGGIGRFTRDRTAAPAGLR